MKRFANSNLRSLLPGEQHMDFENAVGLIGTAADLRRAASAAVIGDGQKALACSEALRKNVTENPQ
jgi:hypothetical protein